MLTKVIAEAEAIFMVKVNELAAIQPRYRRNIKQRDGQMFNPPDVTEESLGDWLAGITHNPNGRHRKLHTYATAYYRKQQIIYNPLWVERQTHEDLLDTVLHEMGHLFTYHFFRRVGHQQDWRHVGTIVGYAQVGSTAEKKRKRYRAYAANAGMVEVPETTMGRIGAVVERNMSTVRSPVKTVWAICDLNPHLSRKQIIAICVSNGINHNTASTQYYHWKRAQR